MKKNNIILNNLAIGYRKSIIAENLNATIFGGELTCLAGVNGVGKSTLLRTLAGFQPPLAGYISYQLPVTSYQLSVSNYQLSVSNYQLKELSHIIGVVLTEKITATDLSVTDLVGMGRNPYTNFWGQMTAEDRQIVREAIAQVGITELANRPTDTLSDGERQKVMIAKVLAQQTPVIFLDEPTAFLDYPSKVEIMNLLRTLSRETGKAIFLSSHDLELVCRTADKLWVLDKSRGLIVGSPEELTENGCLKQIFQYGNS
ncbi:ABC transporter ATP-binding protein [Candidatus Symbiothrix dinenymphae]|uniref:ABC transporter ATP-binding protein n=1 Tax=Candidatus Symbiothrix dinenymphae TaxID=467085 RepID=UPI0006C3E164|nr:ABC transporter ATP-binding protein [Candidatus Symbiothrix dinenymphae]GAP72573.1 iron(III) ABC transporter [Candidatus Symbiothrix dinenymphae]